MQYLTFEEYQQMGGTVTDETTFNLLQQRVESKLNYVTFGRLQKLYDDNVNVPETEVKMFEVDMINVTYANNPDDIKFGIRSYSNGIESITNLDYAKAKNDIDKTYNRRLIQKAQEYLWNYPELFYRGRR